MKVKHTLVRRMKFHVHSFYGGKITYTLGVNGYCWVQMNDLTAQAELRKQMAFIRNSILALEEANLPIYKETLELTV